MKNMNLSNLKSLKSGAQFSQKEALRLAKVFNKKGSSALAKEFGAHAATLTVKGKEYAKPFLSGYSKQIGALQPSLQPA
jgi:hypothetical protein